MNFGGWWSLLFLSMEESICQYFPLNGLSSSERRNHTLCPFFFFTLSNIFVHTKCSECFNMDWISQLHLSLPSILRHMPPAVGKLGGYLATVGS